jgi:hypothetical protein
MDDFINGKAESRILVTAVTVPSHTGG